MFLGIAGLIIVVIIMVTLDRMGKEQEKHRLACKQLANDNTFIKTYSGGGRFTGVSETQICVFNAGDKAPLFVTFTVLRDVELIINGERHLATDTSLKRKIQTISVQLLTNDMSNPMHVIQFYPLPYPLDLKLAKDKANEFLQVVKIGLNQ
jgi:hypothetical protein